MYGKALNVQRSNAKKDSKHKDGNELYSEQERYYFSFELYYYDKRSNSLYGHFKLNFCERKEN